MEPDIRAIVNIHLEFPDPDIFPAQLAELQANSPTYQAALDHIASMNLQAGANGELEPPFSWIIEIKVVGAPPMQALTLVQDLGSEPGGRHTYSQHRPSPQPNFSESSV
jgi:hypothetical protein